MNKVNDLNVKIYADGADLRDFVSLLENPMIKGFTTNPSLMRQAGIQDYETFAKNLLKKIGDHPVSFEVFADDLSEMEAQARVIASWGKNVYVKIPVTNTRGEFTGPILSKLSAEGIALNVTAILTIEQVSAVTDTLAYDVPSIISVFAGRMADAGVDPIPMMKESARIMQSKPKSELLWASSRELLNIFHAEESNAHIITVSPGILKKLSLVGKDLNEYSLETVKMFHKDATASAYKIQVPTSVSA